MMIMKKWAWKVSSGAIFSIVSARRSFAKEGEILAYRQYHHHHQFYHHNNKIIKIIIVIIIIIIVTIITIIVIIIIIIVLIIIIIIIIYYCMVMCCNDIIEGVLNSWLAWDWCMGQYKAFLKNKCKMTSEPWTHFGVGVGGGGVWSRALV